jgi:hypothetical protein
VNVGFAAYFAEIGRVGLVEENKGKTQVTISGTKMRELLDAGEMPDERVMRPSTRESSPTTTGASARPDRGTLRPLQVEAGSEGPTAPAPRPMGAIGSARPEPKAKNNFVVVILDSCRFDAFVAADPKTIRKLGELEKRYSVRLVDGAVPLQPA